MLNDFTWNMTGYIPKHQVNPHSDSIIPYVAERIFQLEPEPPAVDSLNEYILSALQEKNLIHFSFFLHHYEPQLNKRIKDFLGVDGGDLYDTDRFIDIKLSCREQMLQKLMDYDLTKGAEYATYIYPFIRDAMLRFRMGEEKWSVSSLTNYKMVRSMAWLYHNTKDAVNEFSKKYNCDLALAEDYLKVVRGIRNQQPFYVTDEDGEETGEDVALDPAGGEVANNRCVHRADRDDQLLRQDDAQRDGGVDALAGVRHLDGNVHNDEGVAILQADTGRLFRVGSGHQVGRLYI